MFYYIPSMNGLTAEMTKKMNQYIPLDINKVILAIPKKSKRLYKITLIIL